MPKKTTRNEYLDEDLLFLILKLLDYPNGVERTFNFDELNLLNFKKPILYPAFDAIYQINNAYGIQLDNFRFDRYGVFYSDKKVVRNHFYKILYANKIQWLDNPLKNIIENHFTLLDLKRLEEEQKLYFPLLLEGINFEIIITQKLQDKLLHYIKKYIKLFEGNKLQKNNNLYRNFEDCEKIFRAKIVNDYDKYNHTNLVLKDFEFENDFRLLECILALDFNGDIKINHIISEKNSTGKNIFIVSFELSNNFLEKIGRSKNDKQRETPSCFIKNESIFFQITSKATPKKIGRTNTQKSRLLQCLVEDFKFNRERTIDSAFEIAYKQGFNRKTGKYPNQFSTKEKKIILENTFKELRRAGMSGDFKLTFNKSNKTIRMAFSS